MLTDLPAAAIKPTKVPITHLKPGRRPVPSRKEAALKTGFPFKSLCPPTRAQVFPLGMETPGFIFQTVNGKKERIQQGGEGVSYIVRASSALHLPPVHLSCFTLLQTAKGHFLAANRGRDIG